MGKHCETCYCGRRAPVQGDPQTEDNPARARGTISWEEHLECYAGYAAKYGSGQSAETLAARGGFGYNELIMFMGREPSTWMPK